MKTLAANTRRDSRFLASATADRRDAALGALADMLEERTSAILDANRADLDAAARDGLSAHLLARLKLTDGKLMGLAEGLRQLVGQGDPLGRPLRKTELDDGLMLTQVTSPLGVLLVIFESRPDAVIQIGGLALRTGNGLILKGGKEAKHSNAILVACIQDALEQAGLPRCAVVGVEGREAVAELLDCEHDIDLVIPRGSAELVRTIQQTSRIPVMGHADGICHTYIDAAADPRMATAVTIDGKCDYPSACNATESLLVHAAFLPHLRELGEALAAEGVVMLADARASAHLSQAKAAEPHDGRVEYGDLRLAVRVVDSLEEAIARIHEHGSGHTETIVTDDETAAQAFLDRVDSASVFHNASTRFADGFRYGLGAEVGISTGRIHARGPVGADGLLTTRWLLQGSGQVAASYGPGKQSFKHRRIPL